jgi:hypothetical protein
MLRFAQLLLMYRGTPDFSIWSSGPYMRGAAASGIKTTIGNHRIRATRITAYLKNGSKLENAAATVNHVNTRTTQLYDCRQEEFSFDEVERIVI